MISLLMSFGFWKLYLFADAYQDAHHQNTYGEFSHKTNFYCRTVVGLACTAFAALALPEPETSIIWGAWLVCTGWFFFDLMHNKLTKQKWNYVGSGAIDLWFKKNFREDYTKVIMRTKYMVIAFTTSMLIIDHLFNSII